MSQRHLAAAEAWQQQQGLSAAEARLRHGSDTGTSWRLEQTQRGILRCNNLQQMCVASPVHDLCLLCSDFGEEAGINCPQPVWRTAPGTLTPPCSAKLKSEAPFLISLRAKAWGDPIYRLRADGLAPKQCALKRRRGYVLAPVNGSGLRLWQHSEQLGAVSQQALLSACRE